MRDKELRYIKLEHIDSTNRYLMGMAKQGKANDEDVIVATAQYQSAGKGCGTNSWESEEGKNLLFSILIHPTGISPRYQYLLSMTEAIALRDAIAEVIGKDGDKVTIKWPNDIYYEDKKLSGTLINLNIDSHGIKDLVIGTGINVNQTAFLSDAPNPISIFQIIGKESSIDGLLESIMDKFQSLYTLLINKGQDEIVAKYHEYLYRKEGFHTYEDKDGAFEAEIQEVQPDGIIILKRRDGTLSKYEFKEVKFIIQKREKVKELKS